MIINYNNYIKESNTIFNKKLDYIVNNFQTLYNIGIFLKDYKYYMDIIFEINNDDLDYLEVVSNYYYNNNDIDRYKVQIDKYIKDVLKIDFKNYELNEKLFLYLKIKFNLEQYNLDNYNYTKIEDDRIYLSKDCTLNEIFYDLKKVFKIEEYNNIEKFINDNIKLLTSKIYINDLIKILNYCEKDFKEKYLYIINAKNFDLI